jgi:hypothetical protein
MGWEDKLSPEDRAILEEHRKVYPALIAAKPHMSDEEFMALTEASDEQYKKGIILPGTK